MPGDTTAQRVISWVSRLRRGVNTSTPLPAPFDSTLPDTIRTRYVIGPLLGRGGTGDVYRAYDQRLNRDVALKLVTPELLSDPASRQRFTHDLQTLSHVRHPGIVEILEFGTLTAGGYIVMEFLRGEDLRGILHREGPLDRQRALRVLAAVCSAVEAAHGAGVLHRDLKPENIMVSDDLAEVKILDFGVTKVVAEESVPASAPILGTPPYMAPEQFRGMPFEASSDIFSLGVLAYEMLSGELPFGRGSVGEIVLAQSHGAPPLAAAGVPPGMERAIRMALDPNPDRRPTSARAFAHMLAASVSLP
jgi:serine/threonine-protein kinase